VRKFLSVGFIRPGGERREIPLGQTQLRKFRIVLKQGYEGSFRLLERRPVKRKSKNFWVIMIVVMIITADVLIAEKGLYLLSNITNQGINDCYKGSLLRAFFINIKNTQSREKYVHPFLLRKQDL
jgi:hypothetical protein